MKSIRVESRRALQVIFGASILAIGQAAYAADVVGVGTNDDGTDSDIVAGTVNASDLDPALNLVTSGTVTAAGFEGALQTTVSGMSGDTTASAEFVNVSGRSGGSATLQLGVGATPNPVTVAGVADGTADDHAVNLGQLNTALAGVSVDINDLLDLDPAVTTNPSSGYSFTDCYLAPAGMGAQRVLCDGVDEAGSTNVDSQVILDTDTGAIELASSLEAGSVTRSTTFDALTDAGGTNYVDAEGNVVAAVADTNSLTPEQLAQLVANQASIATSMGADLDETVINPAALLANAVAGVEGDNAYLGVIDTNGTNAGDLTYADLLDTAGFTLADFGDDQVALDAAIQAEIDAYDASVEDDDTVAGVDVYRGEVNVVAETNGSGEGGVINMDADDSVNISAGNEIVIAAPNGITLDGGDAGVNIVGAGGAGVENGDDGSIGLTATDGTSSSQVTAGTTSVDATVTDADGDTLGLTVRATNNSNSAYTSLSGGTGSTTLTLSDSGASFSDHNGDAVVLSGIAPGVLGTDAVNVNQLNSGLAALRDDAYAGIAIANALDVVLPQEGNNMSMRLGAGYYGSASAYGLTLVGRVRENVFIDLGYGLSTEKNSGSTNGGKAGITIQW